MGKRVAPDAARGLQRAPDDARLDFVFGGMLGFSQRLISPSEKLRRTVRILIRGGVRRADFGP